MWDRHEQTKIALSRIYETATCRQRENHACTCHLHVHHIFEIAVECGLINLSATAQCLRFMQTSDAFEMRHDNVYKSCASRVINPARSYFAALVN